MNESKIKDLSKMKIEEYLKTIINGNKEDPIIKQFNNSIRDESGKKGQSYAIIAALGYVCYKDEGCDFYKEASKGISQPYFSVDFYKNISFNIQEGDKISYSCFEKDKGNFYKPKNCKLNEERFEIITNGIDHKKSTLKDFFNQIWEYVRKEKKEKMQVFIREAFGINMDDKNIEIKELVKSKINAYKQIIFTGAPGTGKTYSVREYIKEKTGSDESRYKFVQFHSSYDYTDFVEGIRPAPKNEGENMFVRMDGTFKAFCRTIVEKNEEEKKYPEYYFVIDEINRADLSKVFGELMFGLEEGYRGEENRFPTQYNNLPTYHMSEGKAERIEYDCFKDGFYVPENLTIIGTMNDIDRSVETFDFALRRRFQWVEIKANDVMLKSLADINDVKQDDDKAEKIEKIANNIIEMNKIISGEKYKKLGLNESYHIGPAYFKGLLNEDASNNLDTIFTERIEPLLREYTRGRDSGTVNEFVNACKNSLMTDSQGTNNE